MDKNMTAEQKIAMFDMLMAKKGVKADKNKAKRKATQTLIKKYQVEFDALVKKNGG